MGIPFHQAVYHWDSALMTKTFMAQLKKTRGLVCQTAQVSAHLEAKGTEGAVEKRTPHRTVSGNFCCPSKTGCSHRFPPIFGWIGWAQIPIGSMYGIYANIWGILMVKPYNSIHGSYGY